MNMAAQIAGERIVKQVADEVQAREVLAQRYRPMTSWHYAVALVAGALWGVLVASQLGPNGPILIGAAAGVGLFVGAASYRQGMQMRRRLDAIQVLLQVQGR